MSRKRFQRGGALADTHKCSTLLARLTTELLQAALSAKESGGHKFVSRIAMSFLMVVKDSQQRIALREMFTGEQCYDS